jgi:hypothetical protein
MLVRTTLWYQSFTVPWQADPVQLSFSLTRPLRLTFAFFVRALIAGRGDAFAFVAGWVVVVVVGTVVVVVVVVAVVTGGDGEGVVTTAIAVPVRAEISGVLLVLSNVAVAHPLAVSKLWGAIVTQVEPL